MALNHIMYDRNEYEFFTGLSAFAKYNYLYETITSSDRHYEVYDTVLMDYEYGFKTVRVKDKLIVNYISSEGLKIMLTDFMLTEGLFLTKTRGPYRDTTVLKILTANIFPKVAIYDIQPTIIFAHEN